MPCSSPPDTASDDTFNFKKTNNSGRVFLKKGFRLWEGSGKFKLLGANQFFPQMVTLQNKFVAVELDTNKQSFDPDDNHVGIDINGVRSVKYDGVAKVMEVYIGKTRDPIRPRLAQASFPVLKLGLDLREHLNQESYFGFSASTGVKYQLNCVFEMELYD
nr:probable L-type lectin-domain containing receptor kinase S.5 [Ipomoea batatas]